MSIKNLKFIKKKRYFLTMFVFLQGEVFFVQNICQNIFLFIKGVRFKIDLIRVHHITSNRFPLNTMALLIYNLQKIFHNI